MPKANRRPHKEDLALFLRHGGVVVLVRDPRTNLYELLDMGDLVSAHTDKTEALGAFEAYRDKLEQRAIKLGLV